MYYYTRVMSRHRKNMIATVRTVASFDLYSASLSVTVIHCLMMGWVLMLSFN